MATSKANRHLLVNLVRGEVERSVARMGLVSTKDMEAAERRAKGLERRVAELEEELSRSTTARKAANTRATKGDREEVDGEEDDAAKKTTAKKATAKTTDARPRRRRPSRSRRRPARRPRPTDAATIDDRATTETTTASS